MKPSAPRRRTSNRLLWLVGLPPLLILAAAAVYVGLRLRQESLDAALIQAIKAGRSATAVSLLNQGANANAMDAGEWRPSVRTALAELWARLRGVRPRNSRALPALMLACEPTRGNCIAADPILIQALLARGANANAYNAAGITALDCEIMAGGAPAVRLLLEHGAVVNPPASIKISPLALAARDGRTEITGILLDHGAAINGNDTNDLAPIMYALDNSSPETMRLLLSRGADPNVKDNGRSLLMTTAGWGMDDHIRILVKFGAKIDARDADGQTALIFAVDHGREENVRELVRLGANVKLRDKTGQTALSAARIAYSSNMTTSFLHVDPDERKTVWRNIVRLLERAAKRRRSARAGRADR